MSNRTKAELEAENQVLRDALVDRERKRWNKRHDRRPVKQCIKDAWNKIPRFKITRIN